MNIVNAFSGMSVSDIAAAKQFYSETLALRLEDDTMGLHYELPNGGQLYLYAKPDHQPASYTALNLVVNDINAAIDELAAKGVTPEHYENLPAEQDERGILRGKAAHMGPDIAWITDPSGNIIALLES